jgi:hypothetical protein
MMFAKPTGELTFDDVQALVDNQEPEGVTLEYKREMDRSPAGKKELAKDVSAMANSQGGYLIIGLAEDDDRPKLPERFVDRMLVQQKVEEWVEQVLNSNIQQRANVRIKPIPVPGKPDECVVVVHVPQSPRVPHMVTTDGEKRYYVRHNFQTLPAEEYEVRDMYERGRRMREEVQRYLRNRGFANPEDDPEFEFGVNKLTAKLGTTCCDQQGQLALEAAHTIIAFVSCPWWLDEWIDTSSQQFAAWFEPTIRNYYPHAAHGIVRLNKVSAGRTGLHDIDRYLAVHRTGYVEYAYGAGQRISRNGEVRVIEFVPLVGRFWQFLGFVRDLYQTFNVPTSAVVALSMANVEGTDLAQFADGWPEPWESAFHTLEMPRRSLEPHIWICRHVDFGSLDEARTESIVRHVAARIGSAFGHQEPPCFRRKDRRFPEDRYRQIAR